jgi:hypothetical protein
MDIKSLDHFYNCHFAMNRFIWDTYIMQLTDEQFNQANSHIL